ncbi:MAG: hypothetical protein QME05_05045 [Candidatus Margulisbacteria bacterium]|nr:hypothetical protein [Candidatus Margulisiibacteriota bacterium]
MRRIAHNGGVIESELLWDNQREGIELKHIGDAKRIMLEGLRRLQAVDPPAENPRVQRAFAAAGEFAGKIQALSRGIPITSIDISPALFIHEGISHTLLN